jgi:hypothetical protein
MSEEDFQPQLYNARPQLYDDGDDQDDEDDYIEPYKQVELMPSMK